MTICLGRLVTRGGDGDDDNEDDDFGTDGEDECADPDCVDTSNGEENLLRS